MFPFITQRPPGKAQLKKFIGRDAGRRKRLTYLSAQKGSYAFWLRSGELPIAMLGGIKAGKNMEVWYWEHDPAGTPFLKAALNHLFASISPKSVLWYPNPCDGALRLLSKFGFRPLRELEMELQLKKHPLPAPASLPGRYRIEEWKGSDRNNAVKLNLRGNRDTINSLVTVSLSTLAGCARNIERICLDKDFLGGHTIWRGNSLVGYHLASKSGRTLVLNSLIIDPLHRDRGLGEALFTHTISRFGEEYLNAGLGVYDNNPAAIKIYRRTGFRIRGKNTFYLWRSEP